MLSFKIAQILGSDSILNRFENSFPMWKEFHIKCCSLILAQTNSTLLYWTHVAHSDLFFFSFFLSSEIDTIIDTNTRRSRNVAVHTTCLLQHTHTQVSAVHFVHWFGFIIRTLCCFFLCFVGATATAVVVAAAASLR